MPDAGMVCDGGRGTGAAASVAGANAERVDIWCGLRGPKEQE